MFFKTLFLLLVGVSVVLGCFGGADSPLQEEVDEPGVFEISENKDPLSQDLASHGPVVRLVSHGIEEKDEQWVSLLCHAEIESPLNHHLLVYIGGEQWGHDDFFGRPGHITHFTYLVILEQGNTKTGKVSISTSIFEGGSRHKKLVLRLLPGEDRFDIDLPRQFIFGERDGGPHPPVDTDVRKGHPFNPYRVGEPSELSHEID